MTEADSLACCAAAAAELQVQVAWKGGIWAAGFGPFLAGVLKPVWGLGAQSLMQAQRAQHAAWLCLPSLDCSPALDGPGLCAGAASATDTCSCNLHHIGNIRHMVCF